MSTDWPGSYANGASSVSVRMRLSGVARRTAATESVRTPAILRAERAFADGLVLVHAAVGDGQQGLVRLPVVREDRAADADADLHRPPVGFEAERFDRLLQFLPFAIRILGAAPGQHQHELVAGVARADVVGTDRAAQHARHLGDGAVADMMAERVVDLLDAVEIGRPHV